MITLRHMLFVMLLLPINAHTAEPAKMIFGVELGTPFTLPPCAQSEVARAERHCYSATLNAKTVRGTEERHVHYPRKVPAPYARGELVVETIDGVIEAIHVNTWGIQGQGTALEALKKKYGEPARSRSESMKGLRSRLPVLYAEWDMKEFAVRFDGVTTGIDWGRISLLSQRYQQRVKTPAPAR